MVTVRTFGFGNNIAIQEWVGACMRSRLGNRGNRVIDFSLQKLHLADAKSTVLNAGTRTDARKPSMCVQHFIVINTYNELLSAQKRGSPHGARRAHGHIISVRTESLAGPGQLPPILLILNDPPNCPFSS